MNQIPADLNPIIKTYTNALKIQEDCTSFHRALNLIIPSKCYFCHSEDAIITVRDPACAQCVIDQPAYDDWCNIHKIDTIDDVFQFEEGHPDPDQCPLCYQDSSPNECLYCDESSNLLKYKHKTMDGEKICYVCITCSTWFNKPMNDRDQIIDYRPFHGLLTQLVD